MNFPPRVLGSWITIRKHRTDGQGNLRSMVCELDSFPVRLRRHKMYRELSRLPPSLSSRGGPLAANDSSKSFLVPLDLRTTVRATPQSFLSRYRRNELRRLHNGRAVTLCHRGKCRTGLTRQRDKSGQQRTSVKKERQCIGFEARCKIAFYFILFIYTRACMQEHANFDIKVRQMLTLKDVEGCNF